MATKILRCPGCNQEYGIEEQANSSFNCPTCATQIQGVLIAALKPLKAKKTQKPLSISPQWTMITLTCSTCSKTYRVYKEAHTCFRCFNCRNIIEYNSTEQQRIQPTAFNIVDQRKHVNNSANGRQQSSNQSFSSTKSQNSNWGNIGAIVLLICGIFCALSYIVVPLYDHFKPATPTPTVSSTQPTYIPTPATNTAGHYQSPSTAVQPTTEVSKSDSTATKPAPCVIQSCDITFNSNFEPSAKMVLLNQSAKTIEQVVLKFDFSDMSGWDNTSVTRYLAEKNITYTNLYTTIAPGKTKGGELKIPLPQGGSAKDKPIISIIKVRYSDGTIENL